MPTSGEMMIGRVLTYLVVVVLVLDGLAQILQPGFMVAAMQGSQVPLALAPVLGGITLSCALVLAIPRLAVLGAILVTGFLGGAIAVHFRLGEIGSPPQLICLVIGTVMWAGLYLGDPRIRALLPSASRSALAR